MSCGFARILDIYYYMQPLDLAHRQIYEPLCLRMIPWNKSYDTVMLARFSSYNFGHRYRIDICQMGRASQIDCWSNRSRRTRFVLRCRVFLTCLWNVSKDSGFKSFVQVNERIGDLVLRLRISCLIFIFVHHHGRNHEFISFRRIGAYIHHRMEVNVSGFFVYKAIAFLTRAIDLCF